MNKTGHQIGCIIGVGYSLYTKQPILLPGIILGSFLPDMDCRGNNSYIRSKLKLLGKLWDFTPQCKLFGYEGYKHRSLLLHSFWTLLSVFILYKYFDNQLILGLLYGLIIHHILDFNKSYFKYYLRGSV